MRIYRNTTIVTAILTLLSFIGAIRFNFLCAESLWSNLLLSVFGSSLLTFITSVVGYRVERKKTFEGFSYTTKQVLKNLNKYQLSWPLEQKIDFFLMLHDISWGDWDRYFGEFCFLFDFGSKTREYIFQKIYHPLQEIDQKINDHVWHFRWHKDGSGRNERVMEKCVQEIEDLIIETRRVPLKEVGEFPDDTDEITKTLICNKIVIAISEELNGEYYRLMYGNKAYK